MPSSSSIVTPVAMSEVKAAKTLNVRGGAKAVVFKCNSAAGAPHGGAALRPPSPAAPAAGRPALDAANEVKHRARDSAAARAPKIQTQNRRALKLKTTRGLRQRLRAQRRGPGLVPSFALPPAPPAAPSCSVKSPPTSMPSSPKLTATAKEFKPCSPIATKRDRRPSPRRRRGAPIRPHRRPEA